MKFLYTQIQAACRARVNVLNVIILTLIFILFLISLKSVLVQLEDLVNALSYSIRIANTFGYCEHFMQALYQTYLTLHDLFFGCFNGLKLMKLPFWRLLRHSNDTSTWNMKFWLTTHSFYSFDQSYNCLKSSNTRKSTTKELAFI
jgi:hypothetical protein